MRRLGWTIGRIVAVLALAGMTAFAMRSGSEAVGEMCSSYSRPGIICGMEVGSTVPGLCECAPGLSGTYVHYRCLCINLDTGEWYVTAAGWFCDCN